MAPCFAPVMQATIFCHQHSTMLLQVQHSNMFSTCQVGHLICLQHSTMLLHVQHGTMFSTCHAGHHICHQARHRVYCMSVILAPVKHGTVLVVKQDTMSTECQSWHSVYYLSSMVPYLSSSMTPCLLPVKQSTLSINCQERHHIYKL